MKTDSNFSREGYLKENYHFFHLRDTAGQERDFHFHEFDKIVLLLSGKVDYTVESETYELKPYDVLLVKHHTIHKALIDKSIPYERVIIYLDGKYFDRIMPHAGLMESFEQTDRGNSHLLTPDAGQRVELSRAIEEYERISADVRLGSGVLCETIIIQLLVQINRLVAAAPRKTETQLDSKIRDALTYINENLSRELTVDTLAEKVYLSKYHFMRLFKAQTGSTVHAYIRQKRLLNAARLIREGVSAGKAAEESGFADYSAFNRAFRESFGISPVKLKKQP